MYDECVKAPFLALSDEIEREFGPLHVFRPNRDIRFAKDKSPYKTAAAAVTESEGGAAYYVQISSEGLYVGSGYYHLAPDQLERYRAAVADAKTGPKLAAAVGRAAQEPLRGRGARVAPARAARLPARPSAGRAAAHEGHARRPDVRRAGLDAHVARARPDRHDVARRRADANRWLDKHVGPSTLAPPEPD